MLKGLKSEPGFDNATATTEDTAILSHVTLAPAAEDVTTVEGMAMRVDVVPG